MSDLNGSDPVAYVLSANVHRRNLSKGQLAIAVATIYPDPEKGGRGQNAFGGRTVPEIKRPLLSNARTVLKYLPAEAEAVLNGDRSLDNAYAEVKASRP